jgi:hypothetical protein
VFAPVFVHGLSWPLMHWPVPGRQDDVQHLPTARTSAKTPLKHVRSPYSYNRRRRNDEQIRHHRPRTRQVTAPWHKTGHECTWRKCTWRKCPWRKCTWRRCTWRRTGRKCTRRKCTVAAEKRCTSKSWEAHFAQLCKFVGEHGHARVPWRHTEHAGLGRFVTRAREAYQADLDRRAGRVPKSACRITTDQIRRLESVGFEWRPRKQRMPRTWTVHLAALASYATDHGHARVPYVYPDKTRH